MNGTTTREVRSMPPSRARGRRIVLLVLAAVVVVAGTLLMIRVERHLRGAAKVPELQVVNPSNLLVEVDVSDRAGDSWLPVTIARPRDVTTVKDVVDQGDVWRFRFRSTGVDGGNARLTREELEDAGWRVTVPEAVIERLHEDGARPPVRSP